MVPASVVRESGGFRWRRWHAPLVVLVALLADYGSPAEMWTAFLPLAFMAVLLVHHERRAALAVLFLSSWILLPAAAGVTSTVDSIRGARRLYAVQFDVPGLQPGEYADCYAAEFSLTPVLEDAAPGLAVRVVGSFAALHNQLAVWHLYHGRSCQYPAGALLDARQ
jgi:hypothetical protein